MYSGTSQKRPFFKGRLGCALVVLAAIFAISPSIAEAASRTALADGFGASRVPVSGSVRLEKWDNMLARHRAQAQEARACEETWFSSCPIADWQEMLDDLKDADLSTQLIEYAGVEAKGGIPYTFFDEEHGHIAATEALDRYRATGVSPLSKWQMHLYRRV